MDDFIALGLQSQINKRLMEDITSLTFEVVPCERLGIENTIEAVALFTSALVEIGYSCKNQEAGVWVYEATDFAKLNQHAYAEFGSYEEYCWFAASHCNYLIIAASKDDFLFAVASNKDPNELGPYSIPASNIATQVIGPIPSTAIARMLISRGLWVQGKKDWADRINISTTNPVEAALSGGVSFVASPSEVILKSVSIESWGSAFRPLSIIDTRLLLSPDIVKVLRDDTELANIEIGQALPIPLAVKAVTDSKETRSVDFTTNYFSVKARIGTAQNILLELLKIPLHLNWELTPELEKIQSLEQSFKLALMQRSRLQKLEKVEEQLQYALDLLLKRYPSSLILLEWKVNNVLTNTVRYSPVYLTWKARLESFLSQGKQWQAWLLNRLQEIDWNVLITSGATTANEAEKFVKLSEIDANSVLLRMRVVTEKIMEIVYKQQFPERGDTTLNNRINQLNEQGYFPSMIYVCLDTLRKSGNVGAHEDRATTDDVMAIVPLFIRVVEWFIDQNQIRRR